jgi:2-isopropylmalate synthase
MLRLRLFWGGFPFVLLLFLPKSRKNRTSHPTIRSFSFSLFLEGANIMKNRIYLFDTTLRDGAQTRGINFSVKDKQKIAEGLDRLGIDYIEGGWPGANPTDTDFFASPPALKKAKFTAFGMTCRPGKKAAQDSSLRALTESPASAVCLFGKTWDFHVKDALGATLAENRRMIRESIAFVIKQKKEALFDAEHFFDGFKANEAYALSCLKDAYKAGASWIVLCDTNGGTLPHEISAIVAKVKKTLPKAALGIHCHDDTGNAIANTLAAVRAGCTMIHGTMGGLGERCGNANLISLAPTLHFKMGYDVGMSGAQFASLFKASRSFAALMDRDVPANAPYVGGSAFAHKGGIHASAIIKNPRTYEHLPPELIGNQRDIVVSNQAGLSNLRQQLGELGIAVASNDPALKILLAEVKKRSEQGFAYDNAVASFALLSLRLLKRLPNFFSIENCAVHNIGSGTLGKHFEMTSYASIKLKIGEELLDAVAEGVGPVNALDAALRKALIATYPQIEDIRLTDYHVRILDTKSATAATTRVLLDSENTKNFAVWSTVGMSANIINASLQALGDSYAYGILKSQA